MSANAAFTLLVLTAAGLGQENVIVRTSQGMISGFKELTIRGKEIYSFHSVPYAKPPLGALRLKDPVPHEGWTGIRDGTVMPPLCSQIPFLYATVRKPKYEGSEDCLYLSVFTEKPVDSTNRRPVMFFIHGGAYFAGGIEKYTPYVMLNEDIVLVIIQYRLGMLGFLSTGDDIIPGNFGMKDQVLALQWVQNNIHNFGGDPQRVTIFGESAGGASVHFHILSPRSEGLFARGILQSGTLFSPWAMGASFEEVAQFTGRLFGCPYSDSLSKEKNSVALLSCLQDVDVVNLTLSLMNHMDFNFNPVRLGPRVDGDYLPREPELLMKEGHHKKLDVMSGITSHEGGLFVLPLYAEEAMKSDLLNNFEEMGPASLDLKDGYSHPGEVARSIFDYYVGGVKASPTDADNLCKMYGDWQFNVGHDLFSSLYAKNVPEKKIYMYELNHRGQRSFQNFYNVDIGQKWVSHADDLFYLFRGGNTLWQPLEREDDNKLSDIMTKLWVSFADVGVPTPDESSGVIWEPATHSNLQHLLLNPSPSMEMDSRSQVRKFLQSLLTRHNFLLQLENESTLRDHTTSEENNQQDQEVQSSCKSSYNTKEDL